MGWGELEILLRGGVTGGGGGGGGSGTFGGGGGLPGEGNLRRCDFEDSNLFVKNEHQTQN